MRDLVVTVAVLTMGIMALRKPYIGIMAWSWISYMNPHRLSWGFAHSMPFAFWIALATIAGFVLTKDKKQYPVTPVTILLIVFIGWVTLSSSVGLNPSERWVEWQRFIRIQFMTIMTIILLTDRRKIQLFVSTIVLSLGFFGFKGGIFTIATAGSWRVWGPPDSFIEGNNELALALVMTLPLMNYLRSSASHKWVRVLLVVGMVLCVFSILGSHSRGALLAISVIGFLFLLKSNHKVVFAILLSIVAVVALNFMPDHWFERMGTIKTYDEDTSAMGRINAWYFAWNLARDRPITGGGFGAFNPELYNKYGPDPEHWQDSHSIYFEVLGEQGFVGLGLFLTLAATSILTAQRIIRSTKDVPDLRWAADLMAMVQVSIFGYAVGGAFLGLAYFDLPYHLYAIVVVVQQNTKRQREQKAGTDITPRDTGVNSDARVVPVV